MTTTSLPIPKYGHLPAALKIMAESPHVFVQHKRLMEIVYDPKPVAQPMTYGHLLERLRGSTHWYTVTGRDQNPPPGFESQFLHRGEWPGAKSLAGIADTPLLRRDGTLLDMPGHDAATSLFYAPAAEFPVPNAPTHDDACRAVDLLTSRFNRLPFETESHASAFLAALLTPFARHAFDGGAPLFFFDAPNDATPTLLADYVSLLVHGREIIQLEKPDSERTFRRQLARTQLQSQTLVLISGAETWRSGNALRTALFGRDWVDGIARKTDPRPVTWFAASANAPLSRDVASLVLPIRLRATEDDFTGESWAPSSDFARALLRDRAQLVTAALTILRAYDCAGRPEIHLPAWPGFEPWSNLIAAALVWAGAPIPHFARDTAQQAVDDDDSIDLHHVFEGIAALQHPTRGLTVRQLVAAFAEEKPNRETFRRALDALLPGEWTDTRRVGALLKKHRGRTLNNLFLDRLGEDRDGCALWSVRPAAGSAGSLHAAEPTPQPEAPSSREDDSSTHCPNPERAEALRSGETGDDTAPNHHEPPSTLDQSPFSTVPAEGHTRTASRAESDRLMEAPSPAALPLADSPTAPKPPSNSPGCVVDTPDIVR